jgi:hypothetical protein
VLLGEGIDAIGEILFPDAGRQLPMAGNVNHLELMQEFSDCQFGLLEDAHLLPHEGVVAVPPLGQQLESVSTARIPTQEGVLPKQFPQLVDGVMGVVRRNVQGEDGLNFGVGTDQQTHLIALKVDELALLDPGEVRGGWVIGQHKQVVLLAVVYRVNGFLYAEPGQAAKADDLLQVALPALPSSYHLRRQGEAALMRLPQADAAGVDLSIGEFEAVLALQAAVEVDAGQALVAARGQPLPHLVVQLRQRLQALGVAASLAGAAVHRRRLKADLPQTLEAGLPDSGVAEHSHDLAGTPLVAQVVVDFLANVEQLAARGVLPHLAIIILPVHNNHSDI